MKPEASGELTIGDTVERAGDPAYPFPGVIVGTYDGGFVVAHAIETGLKHIFSAKMLKRRDPDSLPSCYSALRNLPRNAPPVESGERSFNDGGR
jgi:hypothetical protein